MKTVFSNTSKIFGDISQSLASPNPFVVYLLLIVFFSIIAFMVFFYNSRRCKTQAYKVDFLLYSLGFFGVACAATTLFFLGIHSTKPFLFNFFSILIGCGWAVFIRNTAYICATYPKDFVEWKNLLQEIRKILPSLSFFISIMFISKALVHLFAFGAELLMNYAVINELSFERLRAYLITYGLVLFTLIIFFGLLLGSFLWKKYFSRFDKKNFKQVVFMGYGLKKIKLFFRLCPSAKKSPFVVFLAGLTFFRLVRVLIPFVAIVSFRYEHGFVFAFISLVYLYTTYGVTTPYCRHYIKSFYGQRALTLLGWNAPQINALFILRGAGAAIIAKTVKTTYDMYCTSLDGVAEMHKDKTAGKVTISKNQTRADIERHAAELKNKK